MARLESVELAEGWVLVLGYTSDDDGTPELELRIRKARLSEAFLIALEGTLRGWAAQPPRGRRAGDGSVLTLVSGARHAVSTA